jgi:hypothetical protein
LWSLRVTDQINIQQAVTIVVNEAAATTHGLDQVFATWRERLQVPFDSGGGGDIDELNGSGRLLIAGGEWN